MARATSFDAAIVGGGACGLAVLLQLLEQAPPGYRIVMIEKSKSVGPGLAYSEACAGTHINMHANSMSLYANDPDHFARWLKQNPCPFSRRTDFPSRQHYGKYLSELASGAIDAAKARSIDLVTVNDEAVDMWTYRSGWTVRLLDGSTIKSSTVTLALGNSTPVIHKHLEGKKLYFDRPWPNSRLLTLSKDASICILGSRLTAIDEALYLVEHGHTGPIILASRTGKLPKVQSVANSYDRNFALHNLARELEASQKGGNFITLVKRLHDEMRSDTKRSQGFSFLSESSNVTSQFRLDVEAAVRGEVPGQGVLRATAPIIERYWRCLDHQSQQAFLREYMSDWVIHRHAMPLHTAKKLLRLLENNQLRLVRTERGEPVHWDDERKAFSIPTATEGVIHVDAFVEATGIEYDATRIETQLMRNLLSRKILKPHAAGGVHVDFDTLEARRGLHVLGAMTRGVHFYSTAIDRNVAHARRVADSMLGLPPRKPLHVALMVGSDISSRLTVEHTVPLLVSSGHVPFIFIHTGDADKHAQAFEKLRIGYGLCVQNVSMMNCKEFIRSLTLNHIDVGYSTGCPMRFKADILSFFESRQGLKDLHTSSSVSLGYEIEMSRSITSDDTEKSVSGMIQVNRGWDSDSSLDTQEGLERYSKGALSSVGNAQGFEFGVVGDQMETLSQTRRQQSRSKNRKSRVHFFTAATWWCFNKKTRPIRHF